MPPTEPAPTSDTPDQPDSSKKPPKIRLLKKHVSFSVPQLLIIAFLFAALGGYAIYRSFAASPDGPAASGPSTVQLNLRFKPSATKSQRDNAVKNGNLNVVKEIPQIGVKVVRVPAGAADAVKTALSHNPAVDFVEQDQVAKPQEQLPSDPFFPYSGNALGGGAWGWGSSFTHTTEAWDITQGDPSIVMAILDTGIKPSGLTDFNGQISSTWNVMNNTTDATTNAGNHGTYVAGVAGLAINNDDGNAGYCPKCKMMIVQVGADTGAYFSDIASGVTYAADHGAKVINMSFAGSGDSTVMQSATTYAHNKGLILFAAAGNSNCDCKTYPSGDPYVNGVGGYGGGSFNKAGDSNYGSWVHFAAPEGNMTAWPTINGAPGYAPVGGTSVASPAAAGMAALVWSKNPSWTGAQVEQALKSTATPATFSVAYGNMMPLAALNSLGYTDPQPATAPTQVIPSKMYYGVNGADTIAPLISPPQVGQRLVRGVGGWNGASPLTTTAAQWQRCDGNGSSCTNINSLADYTVQSTDVGSTIKYVFTVKNNVGSVPQSELSGVVGGSNTSPPPTISLSASSSSITAGQSSILSWSSTNATSCTASGAWSGTQPSSGTLSVSPTSNVTYTLSCTGSSGSASSSATVLVAPATSPPATPTGLAPTPLNAAVTLTWNANTETDLASYDVQYKTTAGSTWTTVSNLTGITYTASGLTNGTSYDFQLRAKNTNGQTSAWTATVSATPISSQPADTQAPTATINNPANGASISGQKKVSINASATDNNVVIKMELYIDGALKTTVTTTSLSYTWSINKSIKAGSHTITLKAYDAAGNVGQSSVNVTK